MVSRRHILIISVLVLAACTNESNQLEATRLEDSVANEMLIMQLEHEHIPFEVDEQNRIWYSVTHRERINKISSSVHAKTSPVTMALFPDTDILNEVEGAFKKANIPYELEKSEMGIFIKWDDINATKGTAITSSYITRINSAL